MNYNTLTEDELKNYGSIGDDLAIMELGRRHLEENIDEYDELISLWEKEKLLNPRKKNWVGR
jgi:hypothetical protein